MQRLHRIWCISLTQCKERWLYDTEKLYHTLKKITLPQKNTTLSWTVLLIVCLLLLDQVSKRVLYDLAWWAETLLLHPVFNTGIGRSLPMPLWITICLAVVLSGALLWRMKKSNHFPMRALLLIAGALGNAIDRARLWWVRDFIDLQYRPVFNFADIYLTISCLLIIRTTYHTKERL
jgi:signal peptidase II